MADEDGKSDARLAAIAVFEAITEQLSGTQIAVMYDLDDRYIAVNSKCLVFLQLSEGEVLGRKNSEIMTDQGQVDHMERMLAQTRSTREKVVDQHSVNDTDYQTVYTPIIVSGAVMAIIGLCSPVQPELEVMMERNTELESQATLHRSLIGMLESNKHVLTVVVDPEGIIEYISPSSATILGTEALLGTRHWDLVHPDDVVFVEGLLAASSGALSTDSSAESSHGSLASLASEIPQMPTRHAAADARARGAECPRIGGGGSDGGDSDGERQVVPPTKRSAYRRLCADGSYTWLALRDGLRYRGPADRLYFQEVVVSRLLEEESIEHKFMYITRTAHDLKTPVTTFRLALDQLTASSPTADQRMLIEQAALATEFMHIIVQQAIDVGRLSQGAQVTPNRCIVNLDLLLTKCEWLLEGYPKAVPVQLRRQPGCACEVITDGEWLWEILMNFLTNACKYTQSGSIALEISAALGGGSAGDSGGDAPPRLRIECLDTGIGISEDMQQALFKPFAKLQTRCLHGTGIGLYNVQQKCLALKGECGMFTRTGGGDDRDGAGSGSTFWAEIPYTPVRSSLSTPGLSGGSLEPGASEELVIEAQFPNHTVLIVDDTGTILRLLTRMFERKQFTVACAKNGAEALERLKVQRFDIALLDVQMPLMDGMECTRRLRQWEAGREGRRQLVVGLSANSEAEDRLACRGAGMDDFLAKPITTASVDCMLIRYLRFPTPDHCFRILNDGDGTASAIIEAPPPTVASKPLCRNFASALERSESVQECLQGGKRQRDKSYPS